MDPAPHRENHRAHNTNHIKLDTWHHLSVIQLRLTSTYDLRESCQFDPTTARVRVGAPFNTPLSLRLFVFHQDFHVRVQVLAYAASPLPCLSFMLCWLGCMRPLKMIEIWHFISHSRSVKHRARRRKTKWNEKYKQKGTTKNVMR